MSCVEFVSWDTLYFLEYLMSCVEFVSWDTLYFLEYLMSCVEFVSWDTLYFLEYLMSFNPVKTTSRSLDELRNKIKLNITYLLIGNLSTFLLNFYC